jgi:hypothetical protein
MVKEPAKKQIQSLIDNLVKSEIPELQSVAKELTEWTRKLEKHSWQLQQYASQLEDLVDKQVTQDPSETSLAELVKDLEKTLIELRRQPGEATPAEEQAKGEQVIAEPVQAEKTEVEIAEAPAEKVAADNFTMKSPTARMTKVTGSESGLYRTPEGFLVRKRRV